MVTTRLRVVVLGGGILGISTARQLADAANAVTLITEGRLVNGASSRSLSWLNSAGTYSDDYHRLRLAGIDRYRTLAAGQPSAAWLRFDGGLSWQPADRSVELRHRHRLQLARGYHSRWLAPDAVAALVPGVDSRAIPPSGAIWNPGEGWVDLPSLAHYLATDLLGSGGDLVTEAGPARIETLRDAVIGVSSAGAERVAADAVVLAAGAGVPAMAAELGIQIPDATPNALLVTTEPVDTTLRAVLNTPRVSLRPTPDGALAVDAGWTSASIELAPDGRYRVPEEVVSELLAEASHVLAGNPRLAVKRAAIGPKPMPGDGEPVLGRVDQIEGLHLAFSHSGATLALIAGELVAHEVSTNETHPLLIAFNVRRFR